MTSEFQRRLDPDALLQGRLGRLMLAELAGLDSVWELPAGPDAVGGRITEAVARAVSDGAGHDGAGHEGAGHDAASQPWFTDPLALLAPVARAARTWAFSSDGPEWDRTLTAEAKRLRPLAELVAAAPAASWWRDPVAREHQRWLGCAHRPRLARGAAVADAVIADSVKEDARGASAAESDARHQGGDDEFTTGTWWSGPVGDVVRTTRGDLAGLPAVGLACDEDPFGEELFEVWGLRVDPQARVYEVHTPADWESLAATYPREVTSTRRHDWGRWTGRAGRWILPDWLSVARDWDGVHVSVAGYLSTAGTAAGETLLAGWDADQALWLRDVFSDVRQLTTWRGTPGFDAVE
jgi:hypothetical protein